MLLSEIEGREPLLAELENLEILDRLPTRRIFRALLAAHSSGAALTFDAVSSRLESADQSLLAEAVLSEDAQEHEVTVDYGRKCLESLRRSADQLRRHELKVRVKEAERAGNLAEALAPGPGTAANRASGDLVP